MDGNYRPNKRYDDAAVESFFPTLKTGVFDPYPTLTRREVHLFSNYHSDPKTI